MIRVMIDRNGDIVDWITFSEGDDPGWLPSVKLAGAELFSWRSRSGKEGTFVGYRHDSPATLGAKALLALERAT